MREMLLQEVVSNTAADRVWRVVRLQHGFLPGVVNFTESVSMKYILQNIRQEFMHSRIRGSRFRIYRFASFGSCLAMSPPTKTASKYTHIFCTRSHRSRISFVLERSLTHFEICFLNGALYRFESSDPRIINESSSCEIVSAVLKNH